MGVGFRVSGSLKYVRRFLSKISKDNKNGLNQTFKKKIIGVGLNLRHLNGTYPIQTPEGNRFSK